MNGARLTAVKGLRGDVLALRKNPTQLQKLLHCLRRVGIVFQIKLLTVLGVCRVFRWRGRSSEHPTHRLRTIRDRARHRLIGRRVRRRDGVWWCWRRDALRRREMFRRDPMRDVRLHRLGADRRRSGQGLQIVSRLLLGPVALGRLRHLEAFGGLIRAVLQLHPVIGVLLIE